MSIALINCVFGSLRHFALGLDICLLELLFKPGNILHVVLRHAFESLQILIGSCQVFLSLFKFAARLVKLLLETLI
jgi:hypothetical protein